MNFNIYRVKYKKRCVFLSAVFFGVLISALVNLIIAIVSAKDVYLSDNVHKFDIVKDPLSFAMELSTVIDLKSVAGYFITGAAIGAIAGIVLAILVCLIRSAAENRRSENAEDIRACLDPVRSVVADGYVVASKKIPSINNSKNKGTLLLTESTLEFYDKDYTAAQKNFLLKLSDVISVRSKSSLLFNNKIIIMTTKASYTFRVPIGTAREWKRMIKAAI